MAGTPPYPDRLFNSRRTGKPSMFLLQRTGAFYENTGLQNKWQRICADYQTTLQQWRFVA